LLPDLRPEVGVAVVLGGKLPEGVPLGDDVHLVRRRRSRRVPRRPVAVDEMKALRRAVGRMCGDRTGHQGHEHETGTPHSHEDLLPPWEDTTIVELLWVKIERSPGSVKFTGRKLKGWLRFVRPEGAEACSLGRQPQEGMPPGFP